MTAPETAGAKGASGARRRARPAERKNDWPAAWRTLMKLRRDPDDTSLVFEIFDALPGSGYDASYAAFRESEVGRRVLAEQRVLLDKLNDRDWLASLPEGSLGRAYHDFTAREQLSADGLVEASLTNPTDEPPDDPDAALFYERLRDMHDLEHVVSGYGRDLVGEASVLTLDLAQRWYAGLAVIVGLGYWEGSKESRAVQREAWPRGKQAKWLGCADWERHLEEPLDQVRRELGLGTPPNYTPSRSAGAPDLATA